MAQFETGKGGMPSPEEVARRIAVVAGYPVMDPDTALDRDGRQDVFFTLADDRTAARAVVIVSNYSRDVRNVRGQDIPIWSANMQGDIGHYDPAQQKWLFYPECIRPEEMAALNAEMEQQAGVGTAMLEIESEYGMPYDDMRDPLTIDARSEMAQLLCGTGIVERLIIDDPLDDQGGVREIDKATSVTLGLTSRPNLHEAPRATSAGPYSVLTLAYRGLRVRGEDAITRVNHDVQLAFKTNTYPTVWTPNQAYIDTTEWLQLAEAPAILQGYARRDSRFSPSRCTIAYNRMD